jgi:hypothetical protein
MSLPVDDLVRDVRRLLDEITMDGEVTALASEYTDTFSSNFSDEEIENWLLDGARFIAARTRANFLPELITTINPTNPDAINPATGAEYYPFLRFLPTRFKLSNVKALRRTLREYLKEDSAEYSASEPVYIAQDYEIIIAGNTEYSSDGTKAPVATAGVVSVPRFGGGGVFDGITWTGAGKTLPLDARLREALLQYAASSAFLVKGKQEAVSAWKRMVDLVSPYAMPVRSTLAATS